MTDIEPTSSDWDECMKWLQRCSIYAHKAGLLLSINSDIQNFPDNNLPNNIIDSNNDSSILNLLNILHDGVVLCQLLAVLSDNQVDGTMDKDFCIRAHDSPFLSLQNIRIFLRYCQKSPFSLAKDQLFEPSELYEFKNFGKVLSTLSQLSKCEISINNGIKGFNLARKSAQTNSQYYNTLEKKAGQALRMRNAHHDSSGNPYVAGSDADQEVIYDSIIKNNLDKDNDVEEDGEDESQAGLSKRDHCIAEILSTEKKYLNILRVIKEDYKRPLHQILQPQEHDVIFQFVDELLEMHREFLSNLNLSVSPSSQGIIRLSDALKQFAPFLTIYGKYCTHLNQATALLVDILNNESEKSKALQLCKQKSSESKFTLKDLLVVPMQRVLKYHLLVEVLVKNTPDGHPEKISLREAVEDMKDIAGYINEVKRDLETVEIIDKIQDRILEIKFPEGKKLTDYGRRIFDGELKCSSAVNDKVQLRYVFLFDRMILFCKLKQKEIYEFIEAVHVNNTSVSILPDSLAVKKADKWQFGFIFESRVSSSEENQRKNKYFKYYFWAKTAELRKDWISSIEDAQDNNCPKGAREQGYYFEMFTFPQATKCAVCNKWLQGTFFQGYKCKRTNLPAHKACIRLVPPQDNGSSNSSTSFPSMDSSTLPRLPLVEDNHAIGQQQLILPALTLVRSVNQYDALQLPTPPHRNPPLTFQANTIIELLNRDDPEWWQGRLNNVEGWFPSHVVVECRKNQPASVTRNSTTTTTTYKSMSTRTSSMSSFDSRGHSMNSKSATYSEENPWFVGVMDRDEAADLLNNQLNGTFLVRLSKNSGRPREYNISVLYSRPKHLKIQCGVNNEGVTIYFLHDSRSFHSLEELVEYYSQHSLVTIFPSVDTKLLYAIGTINNGPPCSQQNIFYATALYEFTASHAQHLALRAGDRVTVLSNGNNQGWWKGSLNGKVGFFPKDYVQRCS